MIEVSLNILVNNQQFYKMNIYLYIWQLLQLKSIRDDFVITKLEIVIHNANPKNLN